MSSLTKVLITGANGFIGKNLVIRLNELSKFQTITYVRTDSEKDLCDKIKEADIIIHLAGVNRPNSNDQFDLDNIELTQKIVNILISNNIKIPVIFSSTTQAIQDNEYGISKLEAENVLKSLNKKNENPVLIYRLPGVFGKWCKPNYNSVVGTFCYNISKNLPIHINDENKNIDLVHIDDVVDSMIKVTTENQYGVNFINIENKYEISVGELASLIRSFKESRDSLITERVGVGLTRALYSTYLSYLSPENFSYPIPSHDDQRGSFVEMLKTKDSGQFSFFTAKPGVTRGGHYHHMKTEKFLVIKGIARFNFLHIYKNETHSLEITGENPVIVETVPGWSHDITNIGSDELIVMLWANEIFDKNKPDTFAKEVKIEKT